MAKRRKSPKSSKCPEPLNTLIDIAAGITMGAVASHMEKKYNYSKKGKINPYAVSAMGMASGRLKSTEDLLKVGAFLGAMGSFDVDADDPSSYRPYIPEDPVFRQIKEIKAQDNRYAWRLNCEDGSAYGISPCDYETRSEYDEALQKLKKGDPMVETTISLFEPEEDKPIGPSGIVFARVSRLDNGANQYYRADGVCIKVGDMVTVPADDGCTKGIVLSIESWDMSQVPEDVQWIVSKDSLF